MCINHDNLLLLLLILDIRLKQKNAPGTLYEEALSTHHRKKVKLEAFVVQMMPFCVSGSEVS